MIKCMNCLTTLVATEIEVPERGLMVKKVAWYCHSCGTYYYSETSNASNY